MSDAKTERLINLTLALLASKRYLTKAEIFRTVAGYAGTPETMERMFERDKDDLRSLGLDISVAEIDPYFQDEAGYRIIPSNYALDLGELSSEDVAILSAAAALWQNSVLSHDSQSALRKLHSLGIPADLSSLTQFHYRFSESTENLTEILRAIDERRTITFEYRKRGEFESATRELSPYALSLWHGYWYVGGLDCSRGNIRIFKLARISGAVRLSKKSESFTIPESFDISRELTSPKVDEHGSSDTAIVAIEPDRGYSLRSCGEFISSHGDTDLYRFDYLDQEQFLRDLLRAGSSVRIVEPLELVAQMQSRLAKGVQHG
jgi:proteasome accessory factor B